MAFNMKHGAVEHGRTPVLEVKELTKKYGQITTVDNVALEVYPGEIVGLLGANGAGKTTSFHMICGLVKAYSGKIILGGVDVTRWPIHRRCQAGLGYLPQERSTFGALTVEQNIYGAMEFCGYSSKERKKICDELLERFELADKRERVVGYGGSGGLSGGERRRLEVARSLVTRPKILMLDEPFAACDPETIGKIQRAVQELAEEGLAVLINDHAIANTLKITERAYVVNRGRVLCSGDAMEVLCNPSAIHFYFGHEARDNAETIGNAHGYSVEKSREMIARAYEEVYQKWPDDNVRARDAKGVEGGARSRTRAKQAQASAPFEPSHGGRKLLLRRQRAVELDSTSEPPRAETVDARSQAVEQTQDAKRESAPQERRRLSLRRDSSSEAPRRAPSPLERDSEENRYSDRIKGIFHNRRRK